MPKRNRANASKSCLVSGSGGAPPASRRSALPHRNYIVLRYFYQRPADLGAGGDAAFRRWVVLSDHEQRALEELERSSRPDASGAGSSRARTGPVWPTVRRRAPRGPVLGCVSVALLFAGVAAAGLAIATATAIGWLFWRVWSHRADDEGIAASLHSASASGRAGRDVARGSRSGSTSAGWRRRSDGPTAMTAGRWSWRSATTPPGRRWTGPPPRQRPGGAGCTSSTSSASGGRSTPRVSSRWPTSGPYRATAVHILREAVRRARAVAPDIDVVAELAFGLRLPSLLSRSRAAQLLVLGSVSPPFRSWLEAQAGSLRPRSRRRLRPLPRRRRATTPERPAGRIAAPGGGGRRRAGSSAPALEMAFGAAAQ